MLIQQLRWNYDLTEESNILALLLSWNLGPYFNKEKKIHSIFSMPIWNASKILKCPLGWNFFRKQRRFLSVKYLRKTFHHTGFRKIRKIFRSSFLDVDILQWRVQSAVKHLRWSVLQNWLIAKIRYIFSQNAPF